MALRPDEFYDHAVAETDAAIVADALVAAHGGRRSPAGGPPA
jgi:hypothetical protein